MNPVKVGVIGCGSISDIYLKNMQKFTTTEVVACSAKHLENAQKKAAQYGLRACTNEELLKDPEIELIVVLTPAPTHYTLVKQALLAGKHVYTEKILAGNLTEAQELIALAKERNLLLGVAPETFLGSALQTARRAIDEGKIGKVSSFHVVANRNLSILASRFRFLRLPSSGIAYDYGVYHLTALVSLLGPMAKVYAQVGNMFRTRINPLPDDPEFGQEFIYDNEAQVNAVLTTESGIAGTFSLNGDSSYADQAYFTIHGTGGILKLANPDIFGGDVQYMVNARGIPWETLTPVPLFTENSRGVGPADMARCIREGGTPAVSAEMGCHVLDIVETMMESGRTGQALSLRTRCDRPPVFDGTTLLR